MLNLGIEAAPDEACGLLVKEAEDEYRVIQLVNRADDPTRSYQIDAETIKALALKPEVWAHVAVWHTHPGGLVGPSAGDLEHKVERVKYLVVTIPTGEVVWF